MVVVVVLDMVTAAVAVAARKERMEDFILMMHVNLRNHDCIYTLARTVMQDRSTGLTTAITANVW